MLIVPAMNTAGEKVGTWSFPQPCDYLHFDRDVHGQDVIEEVLKTDTGMFAGALQEAIESSRRECCSVALQAFENFLEIKNPSWWQEMEERMRPAAVAQLIVQLSPAWDLVDPSKASTVILVPNEEVGSVMHVKTFGDRQLRAKLSDWSSYWRKRA